MIFEDQKCYLCKEITQLLMMENTTKIYVQPYSWVSVDEIPDDPDEPGQHVIRSWGLTPENEPIMVRFLGFPVFCHIELPMFIGQNYVNWDKKYIFFMEWLNRVLKRDRPSRTTFLMKKKLYYYRKGRKYPMILACFRTMSAMRYCKNILNKPQNIPELGGIVSCRIHETEISTVRKLLSLVGVEFAQWYSTEGIKVTDDDLSDPHLRKISKIKHEYIVEDWTKCAPVPEEQSAGWQTHPGVLSFDIESYSPNHKVFPRPQVAKNDVYIITCIYQKVGLPNTRKRYGFIYGDCEDVPGANIIRTTSEVDLIYKMGDIINELDPEIIIGYNIFRFDYSYLDTRLKRLLMNWPQLGRVKNVTPEMYNRDWESSGYGNQSISYLQMEGRISIDMYVMVKREYKLNKYDLGTVCNVFLERGKHDVSIKYMFETYAAYLELKKKIRQKPDRDDLLKKWRISYNELIKKSKDLTLFETFEKVEDLCKQFESNINESNINESNINESNINESTNGSPLVFVDEYEEVIRHMTKIMAYGIEDSELVIDLFEKLSIWVSLIEMSSINGVPLMDLFTRGQQVRCVSLIYDECVKDSIVIDNRFVEKLKYVGGAVRDPIRGLHDNIICLDFASLYPSIMQAYNIDYTTFVPPEDTDTLDSDCHIIEWEEDDGELEIEEAKETLDPLDPEKKVIIKSLKKTRKIIHHRYRYYKHIKGIIPRIVERLVSKRKHVRDVLIPKTKDPIVKTTLTARQLGLKTTANSFYGFLGVQEGAKLSLIEGALSVTAKGRELIGYVGKYLENKYKAKIIYGDSVTGDTPILIRTNGNRVCYKRIDEIASFEHEDSDSDEDIELGEDGKQRLNMEYSYDIEVWSDNGWTPIKQIIRHKTNKRIYRVSTPSGVIDVTEDHSLLDINGKEVRPNEVKIGDKLLHADLPKGICMGMSDFKGKIGKAKMYYSYCSFSDTYLDYYGKLSKEKDISNPFSVRSIINLGTTKDYVYDLETENHHFAAGIGKLVVHNTDSVMINLNIKDPKECDRMGKQLSEEISGTDTKPGLFPPPLRMEFEKAMRILCFDKKMYAAVLIDKNGNYKFNIKDMLKKGITSARRDSCKWIYKLHDNILINIMQYKDIELNINLLVDAVEELMSDKVDWNDLLLVRGLGTSYKSDNYFMKVFADELAKEGKPAMPGERLEFLVCDIPSERLLGKKMRLPEDFLEQNLKIDKLYYIEHLLKNSIQRLFRVGYKEKLETMINSGYKPNGRYHFIPVEKPVQMIVRLLADGKSLSYLRSLFMKITVPKPLRINIIPQDQAKKKVILRIQDPKNQQTPTKKLILRVHNQKTIE